MRYPRGNHGWRRFSNNFVSGAAYNFSVRAVSKGVYSEPVYYMPVVFYDKTLGQPAVLPVNLKAETKPNNVRWKLPDGIFLDVGTSSPDGKFFSSVVEPGVRLIYVQLIDVIDILRNIPE